MAARNSMYGVALRYGLPVAAVGASFAVTALTQSAGANRPLGFLFFIAVLLSGWFGGLGPGLCAAILSVLLIDYFFIPPLFQISGDIKDLPWLIAFTVCAVAGIVMSSRLKRARDALSQARDQLEQRVNERTEELAQRNNDLKIEIAERIRAESREREAQSELMRVTRLTTMGELVASIAHEINQPLAAIVANGSACLRWLTGEVPHMEEAYAAVVRMLRDGTRANEIITRIRALTRKTKPEQVPLDMNRTIYEVLSLAGGELERHQIVVKTNLLAVLPSAIGDRIELQQVVLNLFMNAIEAMKNNTEKLRILMVSSHCDSMGNIQISVEDSGAGIGNTDVDQIFEAFFTTKRDGMGMGLSICRSIVEHHGGKIWALPSAAGGMVFHFTVPAAITVVAAGSAA